MKLLRLNVALLCGGWLAATALPASAVPMIYYWDHPCADDPAGTLVCGLKCVCEADWDDVDNWVESGYPDHHSENVRIWHSNANVGFCDGGYNDGDSCNVIGDCDGICLNEGRTRPCFADRDCVSNNCDLSRTCEIEDYLEVDLTTEAIGWLSVRTESTPATSDVLVVHFDNKPSGSKTLNVESLSINAANGPVTIKVDSGATIQTDSTD